MRLSYITSMTWIFWMTLGWSFSASALDIVQTTDDGSGVSIYRTNKCREMKVGERRQTNYNFDQSPTGVHSYYTLTKTGDKAFLIDLNVSFWAAREYDGDRGGITGRGSDLDDHVDSLYRKKMNQCFKEYGDKLKDSRGNSFRFQLPSERYDRTRFTTTAETVYIDISNKDHRSHSLKYSSDIDCPTMIHETLHLLGLCDEYRETSRSLLSDQDAKARGFSPTQAAAYDCRKLGPEHSVMANQYKALNETYDVEMGFCDCERGQSCGSPRVLEGKTCPANMRLIGGKLISKMYLPAEYERDMKAMVEGGIFVLIAKKDKVTDKPYTLSQKQADVILYPGCEEVNGEYYRCAQDAYRTSIDRGGPGCLHPSCSSEIGAQPSGAAVDDEEGGT